MFKKLLSSVLLLSLICFSLSTAAFSQAEPPGEIENNVESDSSDGMYTTFLNAECAERLYGAPDEVLSSSTSELLEYFLQSYFMKMELISEAFMSSVPAEPQEFDYGCNDAFAELVSRNDFVEVLEEYAGKILRGEYEVEYNLNEDESSFDKVLKQPSVKSLLTDLTDFPNLQEMYDKSNADLQVTANPAFTINGVNYYIGEQPVKTVNNRDVEVAFADRELTSEKIAEINTNSDRIGGERLYSATSRFNCHSYAWYKYSTDNPYWISKITEFIKDGACTRIANDAAQPKDIIVYYDINHTLVHSGVIESVSSTGALTICSKWGQAGVYRHAVEQVPPNYLANRSTGEVDCKIFRYHDYVYTHKYTGKDYHSGNYHYYQYADSCKICNTIYKWEKLPCSGPPCPSPVCLPPKPIIA